jgi:hypothetical protein
VTDDDRSLVDVEARGPAAAEVEVEVEEPGRWRAVGCREGGGEELRGRVSDEATLTSGLGRNEEPTSRMVGHMW